MSLRSVKCPFVDVGVPCLPVMVLLLNILHTFVFRSVFWTKADSLLICLVG